MKKTRETGFRTHWENFLSAFSHALPWVSSLGVSLDMEMRFTDCCFAGSVK